MMRAGTRTVLVGACSVFLAGAWAVLAAVCGACGHENADSHRFCYHCGAALGSGAPAAPEAQAPVAAEGTGAPLRPVEQPADAAAVDEELVQARSAVAAAASHLAMLYLRNAAALNRLTPDEVAARQTPILRAAIEEVTRLQAAGSPEPCSTCGGSGKRVMTTRLLTGEDVRREVAGGRCETCRGTGQVAVPATPEKTRMAQAAARRIYAAAQLARGYVQLGRAWAPAALAARLSPRQTALLRTGVPSVCETCGGAGGTTCGRCQGSGRTPCNARGCVNGKVSRKVGGQLDGKPVTLTDPCPLCGGKGTVACAACAGSAITVCRDCRGTGQAAVCRSCGGSGLHACSACGGSGLRDGALCSACAGWGSVLCTGCHGDGTGR